MRRGASLSIHASWPVRLPETFHEKGGYDLPRLNKKLCDMEQVIEAK